MQYNFKAARLQSGLSATEVAHRLGITQSTVSNWDMERRVPSIDMLCRLADLYGVTTDYLLNRTGPVEALNAQTERIDPTALPAFHGGPVWEPEHGWGIVDAFHRCVVFLPDLCIPYSELPALYTFPPQFAQTFYSTEKPLSLEALRMYERIWVEPISPDSFLREQLRGWYTVKERCVTNEIGQSFYMDTYGARWLAFSEHP